jgi:DNA-binding transcriptional MerR regulator
MKTYDIAEVAQRAALSAATLRFYEQQGLIQPNGRHGLRRTYTGAVFERLALIQLGRAAGFTLREIGTMLSASKPPRIDKAVLAARAEAVDEQIRKLLTIRDGLRHAARCKAPDMMQCPHFRRVLKRAASGRISVPDAPSRRASKRAPRRGDESSKRLRTPSR